VKKSERFDEKTKDQGGVVGRDERHLEGSLVLMKAGRKRKSRGKKGPGPVG